MTKSSRTSNPSFQWEGRNDLEDGTKGGRVHHVVKTAVAHKNSTNQEETSHTNVSLIGFCSDAGVARNKGRIGAAKGPDIIRQMLANMAWHSTMAIYDEGNVVCDGDELELAQQALSDRVANALTDTSVIVLGGGHEVAYGSFMGLAKYLQHRPITNRLDVKPPKIGIINFDAHFDLRLYQTTDDSLKSSIKPSSGTPFKQIADHCKQLGWPFHYACLGVSRTSNTEALFDRADELGVEAVEFLDFSPISHVFIVINPTGNGVNTARW